MAVTLRKDVRNGNYIVDVKRRPQRMARSFKTKEEAAAYIRRAKKELAGGDFVFEKREPDEGHSVESYFNEFSRGYLVSGVRESTRISYKTSFNKHILPELGSIPLAGLDRKRVKSFVFHLVEKGLKRASIRIILSELCAMLNYALEDELIVKNPCSRLARLYKEVKPAQEDEEESENGVEEIQVLSQDEVPVFLQAVLDNSPDCYPIFLAAIHTGMRSGELAGLKWPDIDWNRRLTTVRRIITNRGKVAPTKTNRIRTVDVSSTLYDELKTLRLRQIQKWGERAPEWVFANSEGNHLDMHNLKHRHFYKALQKAGIRRIRFHDLRHTFASLLIGNGESLAYVRDQLGHSSIALTVNTYTHLIPGSNRGAVDKLPGLRRPDAKSAALTVKRGGKRQRA